MSTATIGFIGGSGFYQMEGLIGAQELDVETPFGRTSDRILVGEIESVPVAFMPRHGRNHNISPTNIPTRANIYAMKLLGVERIVSISAVGSLRKDIRPMDLLVPDQLIDRTRNRTNTFFDEGVVAHIAFSNPFCQILSDLLSRVADRESTTHRGGTYVVMEGPQFSTRAESALYRSWGASVIGMTALPEAKLAREAEICYATLALVTDYDTWHATEDEVSVEIVVENLVKNVTVSQKIIRALIPEIPVVRDCICANALENAIITSPVQVDEDTKRRLSVIVSRYFPVSHNSGM